MAKDPAFLFYPGDFLIGTMDLTFEERGQYITMLCMQHQKGHLSEKTIRLTLGLVSVSVMDKFLRDEEGFFYNSRLENEIKIRQNFIQSRINNGLLGGRPSKKSKKNKKPLAKHMPKLPEDINENKDIDNNKKGVDSKKSVIEGVFLTEIEIKKLEFLFGNGYMWALETLSNYKLSNGKTYKSDYHALKGWVKTKYDEQRTKASKTWANGLTAADIRMAEFVRKSYNTSGGDEPPIR